MKKTLLIATIILAGFTSTTFLACTKESGNDKNPLIKNDYSTAQRMVNNGISVENGIMIFSKIEDVKTQIDELANLSGEELDAYNKAQSDFTSLYRQYQIMDEAADKDLAISADSAIATKQITDIPDDLLASIVNKDGIVVVGDSVYQFLADQYRTTAKTNLNDDGSVDWSNGIHVYAMNSNYGDQNWASFNPESRFLYEDNNNNTWPKSNNKRVRALHTTWCSYYGFYSSIGAKVKMERHGTFGWINIPHDVATFNDLHAYFRSWEFTYYVPYTRSYINHTTYNQNVHQKTLYYFWGVPMAISGPIQHKVNEFVSKVTITFKGATKADTWIH
jgi:hypothetical protein